MNVFILIFGILLGLSAGYWGRYRFPRMRHGSRFDTRLGQINLVIVATQGLVAIALPISTNMAGIPPLAFTAAGLLLGSVPIYFIKMKDLRLVQASWAGRHVDDQGALRQTSRWPYTLTYVVGYVFIFLYFLSLGFRP